MFETAELGRTISKDEYRAQVPVLRAALLDVQRRLFDASFPVIVVFAGVDGAGKGETVNLLNEWMDPRWIVTRAFGPPSDEESERPEFWRYWRALPARGRLGLFQSSWYSTPVLSRVYRRIGAAAFQARLNRIRRFERMLADDGALILKFWMHLDKKHQRRRLTTLEENPLTRWRVTRREWANWKRYDRFIEAAEEAIRITSRAYAPWTIVEGRDLRYRSLTVGTALLGAIEGHLGQRAAPPERRPRGVAVRTAAVGAPGHRVKVSGPASILSKLDMTQKLPPKKVGRRLEEAQGHLNLLQRRAAERGISMVMVFEGWDAAGKGGAIRRVAAALDARTYQVISIAAPTDEERAHHYLWRFWRHLSRRGRVTMFDRSWYGRVLVERVEGFAQEHEWRRAYAEINQFEEELVENDTVLVKYWLHVTSDEQLRRFRERKRSPWKQWKLTPEDWRNRRHWADYEVAVSDMVERTSTLVAPWTLVEANDKWFARIKVIETACARLDQAMAKVDA